MALTDPHLAQAQVKETQGLKEAAELTLVRTRAQTAQWKRERGGAGRKVCTLGSAEVLFLGSGVLESSESPI